MDQNYMQIAITGAFALDPAVTTLDELRTKTDAVMARTAPGECNGTMSTLERLSDSFQRMSIFAPVLDETVEDDGIVISRELAKEILEALSNSAGFAAFVSRRFADSGVADYAESVRQDSIQAQMRFRRTAMAQGEESKTGAGVRPCARFALEQGLDAAQRAALEAFVGEVRS